MSGRVASAIVDSIFAPGTGEHYDAIIERILGGRDREWKEAMLAEVEGPHRVLDLACGTGILTFMIRDRFPDCEVVSVDRTGEYLEIARRRAADRQDDKVRFLHSMAEDAPLEGTFDLVISCYLPKYADLGILVPRLCDHLEPGGLMILQDFVWPRDRLVGLFLDRRFDALIAWSEESLPQAVGMFADLRPVIRESRWMEELTTMMTSCGLIGIRRQYFDPEQAAMVLGRKPGGRVAAGGGVSRGQ